MEGIVELMWEHDITSNESPLARSRKCHKKKELFTTPAWNSRFCIKVKNGSQGEGNGILDSKNLSCPTGTFGDGGVKVLSPQLEQGFGPGEGVIKIKPTK